MTRRRKTSRAKGHRITYIGRTIGNWNAADDFVVVTNSKGTSEAGDSKANSNEGASMNAPRVGGQGRASEANSMNTLIDDLVRPTTEIARTIGAVAKGDLGQSMELEVDGGAFAYLVKSPTTEALEAMLDRAFDCVVLDLRLPDMTGFQLLEKMHAEPTLADVPVVVFTGKDLNLLEQTQLKKLAQLPQQDF